MNLLAFMLHGACDLFETMWQQARKTFGARIGLFEHIQSITGYPALPTWEALCNSLFTGIRCHNAADDHVIDRSPAGHQSPAPSSCHSLPTPCTAC